ncbi:hypothetical protein JL722_1174 [Aureococcus anophagefferens]|nr:hypothetical protein JL722_1174 [Aureococcus anophagefferens]
MSDSKGSVRLYVKGVVLGYKRGLRNQYVSTSLIKVEGVQDQNAAQFYLGKRIAYIYKAHTEKKGTKFRVIWGRVMRAHGSSGVRGPHLRGEGVPRDEEEQRLERARRGDREGRLGRRLDGVAREPRAELEAAEPAYPDGREERVRPGDSDSATRPKGPASMTVA